MTTPRITDKDLKEKYWLDLFNRADQYVLDQHSADVDEIENDRAKEMWEETFPGVHVELDSDGNFGDIVFDSEESYTMFLLRFS
jgi:hypothetical protein